VLPRRLDQVGLATAEIWCYVVVISSVATAGPQDLGNGELDDESAQEFMTLVEALDNRVLKDSALAGFNVL
jgi:hypothetical protein